MKPSPRNIPLLLLLVSALAGAANVLAFAPFGYWPLPLLSLLTLAALLNHAAPKAAAARGFAFGLGLFLPGLWWINVSITAFGGLPLVVAFLLLLGLAAYLALYPALACWLFARFFSAEHTPQWFHAAGDSRFSVRRWLLAFPALWLTCDLLRGALLTGFPWLSLGYSQIDGPLKGLAPLLGVQGITGALLVSAGALWLALGRKQVAWLLLPALLIAGAQWGARAQFVRRGEPVKVALVQGNIGQSMKWEPEALVPTVRTYQDLSRQAPDAAIIVWPEAAIPALEQEMAPYLVNLDQTLRLQGQGLITGIIHYDASAQRFYNAVIGLGKGEAPGQMLTGYAPEHANRYYKYHLLPIGEFVPLEAWLRPLAPLFNLPMSSFSRGDAVQPNLLARGFKLAAALCYEIIFPEEVRRNVRADTDFLLTVSNDAWFGTSIGPWQHMEIARMRALELARPLLRATNTGITVVVDTDGAVQAQLPPFTAGVLRTSVRPAHGQTPYHRFGQWPLYGLLLLGLGFSLRRVR
ncbi:MAG: apolipoprotein N-acyltransferase [Aeromonas sp.]